MSKFITLSLLLCASVAVAHCGGTPYGPASGPSVQQVHSLGSLGNIGNLANIEQYLSSVNNGASSAASSAASQVVAGSPSVSNYHPAAPAVAYAPSRYAAAPVQAPSYATAPAPVYAPAQAYGPAPVASYRTAPRLSVRPAYATQLHPGQQNYKTYQSPPQYSTVALPIIPAEPVAKLYVPQPQSYAAPSYTAPAGSYANLASAARPIVIGGNY